MIFAASTVPFLMTGRSTILFGPMIATSGRLITGVVAIPPSGPSEVIVSVDPESSADVALPDRTASGNDARFVVVPRVDHRKLNHALADCHNQERQYGQLRTLSPIGVEILARLLQLRDVDFLDIAEMRDVPLGGGHILRNPAPQSDVLDLFVGAAAARRSIGGIVREESVQIVVTHAVAGGDLGEINTKLLRAAADRRRGRYPPGGFPVRVMARQHRGSWTFVRYRLRFDRGLSQVPGVQEINSMVALSEIKNTTILPIPELPARRPGAKSS
jgi:hypothetical protein